MRIEYCPAPITPQRFKAVAWESREIGEGDGCIEYFQSFPALPIETLERPHEFALCEKLRALVLEAQDHRERQSIWLDDVRQT
jgi:hypothetical protein